MAANLLKAGYDLIGFDLRREALEELERSGGGAGQSAAEVVGECDVVMTSLPSSKAFEELAADTLVPCAREGQTFLDFGTVEAEVTRRTARALHEKGADLLDAPVSGGPGGSKNASLYVFVGGDERVFEKCRGIFEIVGDPGKVTYCGPKWLVSAGWAPGFQSSARLVPPTACLMIAIRRSG